MFQTFMKDQYQWDDQFDMEPQYSQQDMEKAFEAGRASSEFERRFAIDSAAQLQKALVNLMAEHAEIQKHNTDNEKDKWLLRQYAGHALQGQMSNIGEVVITPEGSENMARESLLVATALLDAVKRHESI